MQRLMTDENPFDLDVQLIPSGSAQHYPGRESTGEGDSTCGNETSCGNECSTVASNNSCDDC